MKANTISVIAACEREMIKADPTWRVDHALRIHVVERCLDVDGQYTATIADLIAEFGCDATRIEMAVDYMLKRHVPFLAGERLPDGAIRWKFSSFPAMAFVGPDNIDCVLSRLMCTGEPLASVVEAIRASEGGRS